LRSVPLGVCVTTGAVGATIVPPPPLPPPPPPSATGTLVATVRADYTIDLKHANGAAVTQVAPGTYTIQVDDQAPQHNFHLTGPGVDRATTVAGTGVETWTVTLTTGTYTYVCDPHADGMRGTFTVGSGPAPPPPPAQPPPSAPAKPGVLIATVRANYTLDLKLPNGAKAAVLRAGTYSIEVRDQTKEHNFHLTGPGVNKTTAVAWVGTTKWTVDLKPGTYRFVCDPHAPLMKGSVTVTAEAPKALRVSRLSVAKVGRRLVVRMAVNKNVRARIRLMRRTRALASVATTLKPGANVKRMRLPARAKRGTYRVQVVLMDGARRMTLTRPIRV
jgi:plastocyanin